MPTETVYGLAARALDEAAVNRVFDVKGRPRHHPLIVHLSSTEDPSRWAETNAESTRLAAQFWPGPLTILLRRTSLVPDWVTGGRDTVALRVPSHPVCSEFLRLCADGVVAPSANRFGHVSPTTAEHVVADLGTEVDLVLDGGPCSVGVESTIVECIGVPQVLRPGVVSEGQIETVIGELWRGDVGQARAPGMLSSHYAPRASVVLVDELRAAHDVAENVRRSGLTVFVLHYDEDIEYARNMYADLREFDSSGADVVVAVLPEKIGIGAAVRDRLQKAAADR